MRREDVMDKRGLLFIPDISGFTRFVNETEIGHSRLIIQELLELLINANQLGLEVSEIEGDAILFYKFGDPPDLEAVYTQVERMFCAFHRHLAAYDHRRYCQCKACMSAIDLTLKVITHYGEFAGYQVKSFSKLIGKDVIIAHQLLKNDIQHHEYWLVTQSLLQDHSPAGLAHWMQWQTSAKHTDSGAIPFHYAALTPLKNSITPEPPLDLELPHKTKVMSFSREYATDIITLFHATGDFQYRSRWQEGVRTVEEVNHFLPRVGMRCRCVMENGEVIVYSTNYSYSPERIEFSETEEGKRTSTTFLLESVGDKRTKLTIDVYVRRNIVRQAVFALSGKKKMETTYHRSLLNIEQLVKEIKLPT
jgi:hypothetical protein